MDGLCDPEGSDANREGNLTNKKPENGKARKR